MTRVIESDLFYLFDRLIIHGDNQTEIEIESENNALDLYKCCQRVSDDGNWAWRRLCEHIQFGSALLMKANALIVAMQVQMHTEI